MLEHMVETHFLNTAGRILQLGYIIIFIRHRGILHGMLCRWIVNIPVPFKVFLAATQM